MSLVVSCSKLVALGDKMKFTPITILVSILLIASVNTSINGLNHRLRAINTREGDDLQENDGDRVSSPFESYDQSMSNKQVKDRLDALALYLKQNRSFRAYIVSYGGRQSCHREAPMRAEFAREYLIRVNSADASRIRTIDGGYRVEWTVELWIGAKGALAPTPLPTVKRRQVKINRKCKPKPL
jgi:hypothetical protein